MAPGEEAPPHLVFRLHEGAPSLVREVLLERGWEEYDEQEQESGDWNLYWRLSAFRVSDYENLLPWQRLNHHPKTVGITRKDNLARNLKRMKGTHGSVVYDFSPTTFILPNDYTRFLAEYTKHRMNKGAGGRGGGGRLSGYWICKPVDLSRGRGIFIFEDIKDLLYDSTVIVQRYISSPLLISGYKFDLRIYVCVKSFHPLTVYMYKEGLVRFATDKYNLRCLGNPYAHLTNTSINKLGPFYATDKERVGQGCKWTMSKFRGFLHSQGVDELLLWQKINNIVTLTLLTIAPAVPPSANCVELLGFDVLVDAALKPWLLEVNYSPALSLDCPADVAVKKGLIGDLVALLSYEPVDGLRQRGRRRQRYKRPCYLLSQASPQQPPHAPDLLPASKGNVAPRRQGKSCKGRPSPSPNLPLLLPKAARELRSLKHSNTSSSLNGFPTQRPVRRLPPINTDNIHTGSHRVNKPTVHGNSRCIKMSTKLGPHSKTTMANPSRRTCRAITSSPQVAGGFLRTSGGNGSMEEEEEKETRGVLLKTPNSPRLGLGFGGPGKCVLPDIQRHGASRGPPREQAPGTGTPQWERARAPALRIGDFVLTFPFNRATLKASNDRTLDVKAAVREVRKLIGRLALGLGLMRKRREEEEGGGDREQGKTARKGEFESLFWGPKNPTMLSEWRLSN